MAVVQKVTLCAQLTLFRSEIFAQRFDNVEQRNLSIRNG